jgi:hypothetical protein
MSSSSEDEGASSSQEEELTAEESLATAREHDADGNTEEALLCYGHALQMVVEAAGDETAAVCAPYYYAYGDALMTAEDRTARELGEGGAEEEEEQEGGGAAAAAGGGAVRPTSPGGRERPEDDIELAWEMLEGARVCYSKQPDTPQRRMRLADVHSRLGDVMQANEMFAQAITEYTRAHRLREQALDECTAPTGTGTSGAAAPAAAAAEGEGGAAAAGAAESDAPPTRSALQRAVAAELCNIGRALQWSVPPRTADAVTHYGRAHALVEALRREDSPDQDEAVLFELSEGIASKIAELGAPAPTTSAPARKRKADDIAGGGQAGGGGALPPPGMRGASGAVCHDGGGGLCVSARWLGGRASAGYVLAEKARLTVLLPAGVGGAVAPCRGRVDRWGWAAAREFDAVGCSACVDWDDGFDEGEEEQQQQEEEQPQRYLAVRNGAGTAIRQVVFELADADDGDDDEDDAEDEEYAWPALLSSPAAAEAAAGGGSAAVESPPSVAQLYANDLCRLSVLELGAGSGSVRCRFDTPTLLLNLGTAEHTLTCRMGDGDGDNAAEDEDGAAPAHTVTLSALLPSAPSAAAAPSSAAEGAAAAAAAGTATAGAKEPCMFFDYGVGALQLRLATVVEDGGEGTLQLGIFELRKRPS